MEALAQSRVVAVLRAVVGDARLLEAARTLGDAGVRVIEFTLTTPGALEALTSYASSAPPDACIGAGTVVSAADARRAVDAGATYLVTPVVAPEVVVVARERGVPVLVGALTPTEILVAYRAGASAVKLFPAALGGPRYLKLVRDPFPQVPLVPTGGIGIEEAPAYLAAGAVAVGMGGQLVGDALDGGSLAELSGRARRLVTTLQQQGR